MSRIVDALSGLSRRAQTVFVLCAAIAIALPAQTYTTIYSFCPRGGVGCPDGANPAAGLVQGTNGDLYGTTQVGGSGCQGSPGGCGTVLKITPKGKLTTLHMFDGTDGYIPFATLDLATNGDLYGTTELAGANLGGGTVFRITGGGKLTTLYSFCAQSGCPEGDVPGAALVQATNGAFYGTTQAGGADGQGTIFKITPSGDLTALYSFCPQGGCVGVVYLDSMTGLVQAPSGDLYGTTYFGGANCAPGGDRKSV